MLYCGIQGKVLSTGERKTKDGGTSQYIDLYVEESGQAFRINKYHGEPVKEFGEERVLAVKVYSNENGFYITHAD